MDRLASRLARWRDHLPLIMLVPVLWHLVLLVRIFASRMTYPMDVDWMEGGELYHAHRWLEGQSVYGPSSQGFTPYGYPPLHFVVLAGVGAVFGLDYGMGRAISILCFAVACGVLFRESWRQLRGGPLAVVLGGLAVGLAAASFPVTGGWYDLVRNDTLALMLPVLAAGLVSGAPLTHRRVLLVAALLIAGVYAKQTNAFFAAWICLFVTIRQWRRGLLLAGVTVAGGALVLGLAQLLTDGWFLTWVTLMKRHKLNLARLRTGPMTVLEFAPYLYAVPVLFTFLAIKRWLSARGGLWAGMLLMSVPVSILPHIKAGGFLNNLMAVVFLAGATTLILCGDLVNGLRKGGYARAGQVALAVSLAAATVWLVVKSYDPAPHLVTAEQRRKAVALNELVRGLEGGVVTPDNPFLAARNGHQTPQQHAMAQWDAYVAGITGDIFSFLAKNPSRWLLWFHHGGPKPPPIGKYVYERRVDVSVRTITGHLTEPSALFRRRP